MELHEVLEMAQDLFEEHLAGEGWTFGFDNAKVRGGICRHFSRTITVSRHLVVLWSEDEVRDLLLHEIAHALAGAEARHGFRWQKVAVEIGAKPEAYHQNEVVPSKYVGTCEQGHTFERYRMTQRIKRGVVCRKDRTPIRWDERL